MVQSASRRMACSFKTWERGVGVPGRGGLEYLGEGGWSTWEEGWSTFKKLKRSNDCVQIIRFGAVGCDTPACMPVLFPAVDVMTSSAAHVVAMVAMGVGK